MGHRLHGGKQSFRPHRATAVLTVYDQAEIERVKQLAAAQQAKADSQARALLVAAKALDKAGVCCTGDTKRALEAAHALLGEQLASLGLRLPQRRKRQEAA